MTMPARRPSSTEPTPATQMPAAPPSALAALRADGHAAVLGRRVSVIAATRDAALAPHLMRAVGFRIADDDACVTVFLCRPQSQQVLADIAANRSIAVVFSEPTTHRTLQLKGFDARETPLQPGDCARVAAYREALGEEIHLIGHEASLAHAFLACPDDDLVAVSFTPTHAFQQTPGAHAGQALSPAAT
ncbi:MULTISPECIES: hypothetical protein [Cupriavidus]|nr:MULTISPECIES: hypothetical protein [Cupriavidus]